MTNTVKTDWITPLAELTSADLAQAGGKGANLGELVRAGFPVPPGFVLTTAAYAAFVERNQLEPVADSAAIGDGAIFDGSAIRRAFEAAPIAAEMEEAIRQAYSALGRGPVAVRSSATAEDLPGAAFAGQQETYLNVIGEAALLEAVRRCWASLWGDRAIAYRRAMTDRLGLDQQAVRLAVVVQTMVAADFAGVLFTANPVSGARDEIALDANPGLGEAVVSGLVTPDHYVLRRTRAGWQIAERRAGRREVTIRARAGGGTEQAAAAGAAAEADAEASAADAKAAVAGAAEAAKAAAEAASELPDDALRQLAGLGAAIQQHFGRPMDIEWAWAGGQPFILQARPMTALPEPLPRTGLAQRMLASNFGEMIPTRPYPLDVDVWLPALSGAVEPIFKGLGFAWTLADEFEIEDGAVIRFKPSLPHPTWRNLLAPLRLVGASLRYDSLRWQADPLLAELQARARALAARDLAALSWAELLETVHAANQIPCLAGDIRWRYFPRAAFAAARLRLMLGLLGQAGQLGALLSGYDNKTVEANRTLEQLAAQVRADAGLAERFASTDPRQLLPVLAGSDLPADRAFLAHFQAFLDQYGHRETTLSTALHPTWKDAPEVVLGMIKSFAAHPPQLPSGQPAWQSARDEVLQHRLMRFAPLRAAFLKTLAEARTLLQIREDTHFYATLTLPLFRRTLLEMGRRLVAAGTMDTPEDVFYLRLAELERIDGDRRAAGGLRASVLRRKQARAALEGQPLVDPRLFPQSHAEVDALLHGMAGSPGVVEGPARIVRGPDEFDRLLSGEVLIAPYTNPSWTPLFQRAAAVVVDSGSAASHAAIVAREYHIPAVMSTVTGTQALHDGERIRVDGSRGLVFRVEGEDMEAIR